MFNPKQPQIDDKVAELLADKLKDDDVLIDALIDCLPQFRALYRAQLNDITDAAFDVELAIESYITKQYDLEAKAVDMLIAEAGNVVRTDVDDYKFVPHDARY